ncbi:hypothetical protein TNIN_342861 [Trichonephila inaurata madagascariensis]|uniref:Secreted protein n=1 Tax=Trichonephila inaurata madagascariensis TaxID=2747483 RepID=A0A8X6XJA3_9ARAC|nr:hypothetical protein TNIN_342861 [Trichonephila inaurata madagascariensis]
MRNLWSHSVPHILSFCTALAVTSLPVKCEIPKLRESGPLENLGFRIFAPHILSFPSTALSHCPPFKNVNFPQKMLNRGPKNLWFAFLYSYSEFLYGSCSH